MRRARVHQLSVPCSLSPLTLLLSSLFLLSIVSYITASLFWHSPWSSSCLRSTFTVSLSYTSSVSVVIDAHRLGISLTFMFALEFYVWRMLFYNRLESAFSAHRMHIAMVSRFVCYLLISNVVFYKFVVDASGITDLKFSAHVSRITGGKSTRDACNGAAILLLLLSLLLLQLPSLSSLTLLVSILLLRRST